MNDRPIEPEHLGAFEGLPTDDPRVRNLGPRARAQLRAYRDFVAPGEAPEGVRVADAEARLGETIERELGIILGGESEDAARAAPQPQGGPRRAGGFLSAWFAPRSRVAFAVAALVVVAGGAWIVTSMRQGTEPPLMRGGVPAGREGPLQAIVSPTQVPDGGVRLEWSPLPEADGYRVVFLSADLAEVARVAEVHETHLDLRPGALPIGLASGARLLWRVVAMRGADELARSRTLAITVP